MSAHPVLERVLPRLGSVVTALSRWIAVGSVLGVMGVLGACGSESGFGGDSDPNRPVSGPASGAATPASILGRVVDGSGQPVAGALVGVRSLSDPPQPVPELAVVTDSTGAYSWPGLRPGPYAVTVQTASGAAESRITVTVSDPVTADLRLTS